MCINCENDPPEPPEQELIEEDEGEPYEPPVFCQVCGWEEGAFLPSGYCLVVEDGICEECRAARRRRPLPSYMNEDRS